MKQIVTISALVVLAATLSTLPAAARGGGAGIDPTTRAELDATVVELQAERGATEPTLFVKTKGGEEMAVRLGPHRLLDDSGFTAKAGDRVHLVTFHCASCDADAVAGRVDNLSTGASVELRNDDGQPLWRGGRGKCGNCGRGTNGARKGGRGTGPHYGEGPGAGPGDGTGSRCRRSSL